LKELIEGVCVFSFLFCCGLSWLWLLLWCGVWCGEVVSEVAGKWPCEATRPATRRPDRNKARPPAGFHLADLQSAMIHRKRKSHALILSFLLFNATNSFIHYHQTSQSNFSMSSLKNAINIADDSSENSVVDLTDDKPSKKPKIDINSNADMPHRNTELIPFHLYNTKQSMGSTQYASRPQAVKKYFRTLRETIGFDGCTSERKFHWLVACNFLFDVHYFLQQTLPDILAFNRVLIFYGEGVTAQGVAYWNDLLRGSGNTVEFIRLIPSDPPRSKTNPLDIKIPCECF
jgi:hypothetical protein